MLTGYTVRVKMLEISLLGGSEIQHNLRPTSVFSSTETADRGTQSENKGPLFYVTSRSEEDGQGWGNPGNGLLLDAALNAYVPVDRELTRTYPSRTHGQTRTYSKSYRKACV